MKKILKLLPMLLIAVLGISLASCSDKDEPVSPTELPSVAKDFIITNFPSASITSVQKDKDEYEVKLSDGTSIDFDKKGDWIDVDAPDGKALPTGFYPAAIDSYLAENFDNEGINEISKVKRGYEVEIISGTEMIFDSEGNFIEIGVDR